MAGLESIALAVAHLERMGAAEQSEYAPVGASVTIDARRADVNTVAERPTATVLDAVPKSFAMPPPRRTFAEEQAPRIVSSDSQHSFGGEANGPANNVSEDWHRYGENAAPRTVSIGSGYSDISRVVAPHQVNTNASRAQQVWQSPPSTPTTVVPVPDLASLSDDSDAAPLPPPPLPTDVITSVMESDVLCGRGGETNHHRGNVNYRSLVKQFQPLYIISKRRDKPRIAEKIVRTVRQRGGRFLKKDPNSNTWRDVGNTKAREKTSQALREGAPELRTSPTPSKGGAEEQQLPPSQHPVLANNIAVRSAPEPSPKKDVTVVPTAIPPFSGGASAPNGPVAFVAAGPTKRRRLQIPAGPPPTNCVPPFALTPRLNAPTLTAASPPLPSYAVKCNLPTTAGPPTTISADDEDTRAEDPCQPPATAARGPRLKLLKKRLQHDQSL